MRKLVLALAVVALAAADSQAGPIRNGIARVQENRAERKEARGQRHGASFYHAEVTRTAGCGCPSASCPSACPCPSCPAAPARLLPVAGPTAPCQQCPNGVCPLPAIPAPKFLVVPGGK